MKEKLKEIFDAAKIIIGAALFIVIILLGTAAELGFRW